MHADGKSTLASVSKWNSGKVNCKQFKYFEPHEAEIWFMDALSVKRLVKHFVDMIKLSLWQQTLTSLILLTDLP